MLLAAIAAAEPAVDYAGDAVALDRIIVENYAYDHCWPGKVLPDSPQLAASLHHSAFNAANALGAAMGAAVIDLDWGLRAPSYVGSIAAVIGVAITMYAVVLTRRAHPGQPVLKPVRG